MPASAPFNLDALVKAAGRVIIKGAEHDVLPINGKGFHALATVDGAETKLAVVYDIAGDCVPSATKDQILALIPEQVNAIIGIATGRITEVEQLFPNGETPATTETASPA